MVEVIRTWKRDGSSNRMSLEAAASNLVQQSPCAHIKKGGLLGIRCRLVQGELLETERAVFRLAA